jgi:hypothetical protein
MQQSATHAVAKEILHQCAMDNLEQNGTIP